MRQDRLAFLADPRYNRRLYLSCHVFAFNTEYKLELEGL